MTTQACARAPVRVDPAGGGTDAPPFSIEHGGAVVNFAIARHAYATVDRLPSGSGVTIWAHDLRTGVTADSIEQLPPERLEFLQGFVRRLVPPEDSLLLMTESDVPPGAGLGGSGAVGVAVVAALDRAYGRQHTPEETARLANEIERVDLGYAGGDQDSYGAAMGGFKRLEYLKGGGTRLHRIDVPRDTRLLLEQNSLLVYTGGAHVSSDIHKDIQQSYAAPDSPTLAAMFQLRDAADQMAEALEAGDIETYIQAMNTSCDNLYRLHSSCDSDAHRAVCREMGENMLGRKTCGAGGGGFIFLATRPGRRRECVQAAERLGALVWPLGIDDDGVQSWDGPPAGQEEVARYRQLARQ